MRVGVEPTIGTFAVVMVAFDQLCLFIGSAVEQLKT